MSAGLGLLHVDQIDDGTLLPSDKGYYSGAD
jgi:hypothetical protein